MVIRSEGGTLDRRTSLHLSHKDILFSRDDSTERMKLNLKWPPNLIDAPRGSATTRSRPPECVRSGYAAALGFPNTAKIFRGTLCECRRHGRDSLHDGKITFTHLKPPAQTGNRLWAQMCKIQQHHLINV